MNSPPPDDLLGDPLLNGQFPLSVWRGILQHLELGIARTVNPWMSAILEQIQPQMAALAAAQQVAVVVEARNVVAEAAGAELRAQPPGESGRNTKAVH